MDGLNLLSNVFNLGGVSSPGYNSIGEFVSMILNIIIGVALAGSFISVGYSAFLYANSAGDPKMAKRAWDTFIYGVFAIAITLGAVSLRYIVMGQLLGTDDPNAIPSY